MEAVEKPYDLPPVLTVAEAASFLRVNVKTLYASARAGQIPARKVGGRYVLLRDSLLGWLRSTERELPSKRR